jgi:nucleotide-binding universal stress UspA family protein
VYGRCEDILAGCRLAVIAERPVYEDRPYQVILHEPESWNADLIVVGSHGRTGFDRVVMGSVSEAVALHAKCSVETIRDAALALHEPQRVA